MNRKNKYYATIFATIFGICLVSSIYGQEKKWSLEECIRYAQEHNLTVQNNQLTRLTNEINLKESKYALLPNLNAGAGVTESFGRTIDPVSNSFINNNFLSGGVSANTNLTLFRGGALRKTIEINRLQLNASGYDVEEAKNDVGFIVATNFLNVLLQREQLENTKYQLETSINQLERTKKLVVLGSLPLTNQLDLESQKASNEVNVANAENALSLALLNLKQSMQISSEEGFNIQTPTIEVESLALPIQSASEIYQVAQVTQPQVKSAELNITSNQLRVGVANSAFLPSLSLNGNISTNYSQRANQLLEITSVTIPPQNIGFVEGTNQSVFSNSTISTQPVFSDNYPFAEQFNDNLSQSISLNLNIPIFTRRVNKSNLQRAEIAQQRAKINAKNVRNQLRQSIETALNNALAGYKSYQASQKRVVALEESFRATEKRFSTGSINFVDYQVANNNLFAAKADLLRAKYEYIFRVKIIDFYLGNPIKLE